MSRKNAEYLPAKNNDSDDYYEVYVENDEGVASPVKLKADEFFADMLGNSRVGEGEIRVKRLNGSGNSAQTDCGKYPLDKFSFDDLVEYVRTNYGAGDYRFYVYQLSDKGKMNLIMNKLIPIDAPKNMAANSGSTDMERVLAQQTELLREIMKGSGKPQMVWDFDLMLTRGTAIATVLSPILMAWLANRPKPVDPVVQVKQMLALTGEIKNLRTDGELDDEQETGMAGIFSQFLSMAEKLAMKQAGLPAPIQQQGANQSNQANMNYAQYAPLFDMLLPLAQANADVDNVAMEMIGRMRPEQQQVVINLLNDDNALAFILAYKDYSLVKYADWISALLVALDEQLTNAGQSGHIRPNQNSQESEHESDNAYESNDAAEPASGKSASTGKKAGRGKDTGQNGDSEAIE